MNKYITYLSLFGAGIAAGVLGTRLYFKQKYRRQADEEVEAVKAAFTRGRKTTIFDYDMGADEDDSVEIFEKTERKDPPVNYSTFSSADDVKKTDRKDRAESESPTEDAYAPFFVEADDFIEANGFEKYEMHYYIDDSVLVNDEGDVVSIVDTVGEDCMDEFEELVDSVCYIRNEKRHEDYEITKVYGSYSAVVEGEGY